MEKTEIRPETKNDNDYWNFVLSMMLLQDIY